MKIKINSWLCVFLLSLVFLVDGAMALEPVRETAQVARAKQIVPLGITSSDGPSPETIFVEVFSPRAISHGAQARFSWFDSSNVPVGSYTTGISEGDFLGLRKIRIPRLEFVGEYRLQADVFSSLGSLLGTGSAQITMESGAERMKLKSPLLVREPGGFRLGFDLQNYNLRQEVIPRLQGFYIKDGERKYVLQRKLDPVLLGSREEVPVEFVVEDEFPPGEYYLETWVESASGRYLSGIAESYLQMPGSYARLNDISVEVLSDDARELDISFDGFALLPPSKSLMVQVVGEYNDKVVVDEVMSVPVSQGYFVETMNIELSTPIPFFTGEANFFLGEGFDLGQALLTQSFTSPSLSDLDFETPASVTPTAPPVVVNSNATVRPIGEVFSTKLIIILVIVFISLLFLIMWLTKRRKARRVFVFLVLAGSFGWSVASAQVADQTAACFADLKSQVLQVADFSGATEALEGLNYAKVESGFSPYYQGRSSFGIDVNESVFDMRVYSFGRQTGYVHPPYSPFPVGTQSESWKAPAKEFVVAEEYVRRPDGQRQFLGCGFFRIAANDLKSVTAENYLYDGDLTSVLTEAGKNKLWYNSNVSYDHNDEIMAYWYRLFVYPQSTQNSYFSRYDVAESFPHNPLDDFSILSAEGIAERNESGAEFSELEPVVVDGPFFLNGYYQAIANRFPSFAKKLALRGFLEYENLQKLLASPDAAAVDEVWETVLDARAITKYALAKSEGETTDSIKLYDSVLNNPVALNAKIEAMNLAASATTETVITEVVTENKTSSLLESRFTTFMMVVGLLVLLFVLIGSLLFFAQKRNK